MTLQTSCPQTGSISCPWRARGVLVVAPANARLRLQERGAAAHFFLVALFPSPFFGLPFPLSFLSRSISSLKSSCSSLGEQTEAQTVSSNASSPHSRGGGRHRERQAVRQTARRQRCCAAPEQAHEAQALGHGVVDLVLRVPLVHLLPLGQRELLEQLHHL